MRPTTGPTPGRWTGHLTTDSVSDQIPQPPSGPLVTVVDDRSDRGIPVDSDRYSFLATRILTEACTGIAWIELAIHFVDPETIAALNREHLGGDGPTDVLAFPVDLLGEVPDGSPVLLGDVMLCPAVAAEQASDHSREVDAELSVLLVHGILHLLGHDHADPEERVVMQRLEHELLERHARL